MSIGNKIRELRKFKEIQQKKLALAIGVDQSTVSSWESGRQEPNAPQRKKLAEYFGISEAEFFTSYKEDLTIHGKERIIKIPLLGSIPADNLRIVFDDVKDWIEINKELVKDKEAFALKISGDCLEEEKIYDGDIIFVSKTVEFVNGKIYVVRVNDEYTCKRVFKEGGQIILQRANHSYPEPIPIDPKKQKFEIIGKVIGSYRKH